MNISINKDIEKYQESVVMGLTARQLIFSIASVMGEMKESELAKFTLDVNTKDIINQN